MVLSVEVAHPGIRWEGRGFSTGRGGRRRYTVSNRIFLFYLRTFARFGWH